MPHGSIDRVDWHYETAEKEYKEKHSITGDLTPEQISEVELMAANHIGVFIKWIIDRGFEGEDADIEGCKKVRDREITGSEYLIQYCDGKLWWTDICEDLYPFVEEYYYDTESGKYLYDYGEYCLPTPDSYYNVISSEEDYKRFKERLDMVYDVSTKEVKL